MTQSKFTTQQKSKKTDKQNSNSKRLVEIKQLENTPFAMVKERNQYFLIMGEYKLTKGLRSWKEVREEGLTMTWERIMQVIGIMIDKQEIVKQNIKKQ